MFHVKFWTFKAFNIGVLIITCWELWNSRNLLVFQGKESLPTNIFQNGMQLLKEFGDNLLEGTSMKSVVVERNTQWHPSDTGWVKLNVDATFKGKMVSYGFVLRNKYDILLRA